MIWAEAAVGARWRSMARHAGMLALLTGALFTGSVAGQAIQLSRAAAPQPSSYHDASAPRGRLPAVAPDTPHAAAVIGTDDRVRIDETSVFPFSAIAYLELFDDSFKLTATCTGTFIGPDAMLTAGHCLWHEGAWVKHIRVVPGKDEDAEPFGSIYATDWWVPDAYIASNGGEDFDWGVIRVPPDLITLDTHWMQLGVLDTATLAQPGFTPAIVGYAADKPDATMWGDTAPVFAAVDDSQLTYTIDTAPGQSGSAVWSLDPEAPYFGWIVGIHILAAGDGRTNIASRIDGALLDDILRGCEVMRCTIAYTRAGGGASPPIPAGTRPYQLRSGGVARD
jgi:glutamyl endopeptidase